MWKHKMPAPNTAAPVRRRVAIVPRQQNNKPGRVKKPALYLVPPGIGEQRIHARHQWTGPLTQPASGNTDLISEVDLANYALSISCESSQWTRPSPCRWRL